jgi:hypothetical protein
VIPPVCSLLRQNTVEIKQQPVLQAASHIMDQKTVITQEKDQKGRLHKRKIMRGLV